MTRTGLTMWTRTRSALAAILLSIALPAAAQDAPPAGPSPREQAEQGLELLMKALEGWIDALPRYGAPKITPEGDIIIPRLDKDRPSPPGPQQGAPEGGLRL